MCLCGKFNLVVYDNKFKMSYDKSNGKTVKQNIRTIARGNSTLYITLSTFCLQAPRAHSEGRHGIAYSFLCNS